MLNWREGKWEPCMVLYDHVDAAGATPSDETIVIAQPEERGGRRGVVADKAPSACPLSALATWTVMHVWPLVKNIPYTVE